MRASLIIAAHNEGDSLWKTVQSCLQSSVGLDCEIIVADDASWDGSIQELQRRFPQVRLVRRPSLPGGAPERSALSPFAAAADEPQRQGTSPSKDFGARSARGEVLVFLDGHCKPEPGAIARLVQDVEQLRGQAIITPTITALDVRRWQQAPGQIGHGYALDLKTFDCQWLPLSRLRSVQAGARTFYESPAAIGCALAMHRELYDALWGFDPQMRYWGAEDLDLSLKCWLMGYRILHDPEAIIAHRFQQRFDRYDVPLEHYVVNQLRMARKNFTHAAWSDWVARCRGRNTGQLNEHPEGLWAQIWMLFEEGRLSAEQERAYLLGQRPRDEFWYATRFGLDWPRLSELTAAEPQRVVIQPVGSAEGAPESGPLFASPSPSPDPTPIPPGPETDPNAPDCEVDPECCECQSECSPEPIRYFNGEVQLAVVDLSAGGYGTPWQHRRVYSNQLSANEDVGNGYNWLVDKWPYVIQHADGSIAFIRGVRGSLWFDLVGGSYVGRYGAKSTLTHDTASGLFVLTLPDGERYQLHDYDQTAFPGGLLASHVSQAGQVTAVTAYTAEGRIEEIQRSVTVGASTTTEAFRYGYTIDGRIDSVTLRRRENAGPWNDIRQVLYEYYGAAENYGSLGDLKRARHQVPQGGNWVDSEIHYYRYYKSGETGGFVHGLKYVVDPQAYSRMLADSIDPLAASNNLVAEYAKYHFQYDSQQRAILERVDGASRTFSFEYSTSSHSNAYNHWKTRTVETRPDGSRWIVYTNYIGQVLLKELASGSDSWIQYYRFDDEGREILRAEPSAVTGYSDSAANLNVALRTSDGLIHVTDYYSTTGSGAAKGYKQFDKLKRGSGGTEIKLREYQYNSHTAGGITVYPLSKQIEYRGDDGSGAVATEFSYSYHSGTVAVQERVTTLPAVPGSQNGSNTTATRREAFDLQGNLTWQMDERGFITHSKYDLPTGALIQRIEDVDTSLTPGAPSGWTTPSGGGLNLITDYQHDDLGRQTQSLGPQHTAEIGGTATSVRRASWTVYQDAQHEVWSGQGYRHIGAGTDTLINPVRIEKRDQRGNPLESIQAVRSSTAGKLLPSDSFPQSSYVRWTVQQYSDCCLLGSTRVYHNIPASGPGAPGTNYSETSYGYDLMKRLNRTISPGGTIRTDVFDVRGQVIATYVGTDDSGATATDPTGGGASGNNMLLLSENQYDGGSDGGDGNLTRQTQHVDDTTTRVTQYLYDWRNRQTAADGELDFYEQQFYDNLDRTVLAERRDGSASGQLLSRQEMLYDNRGRVYRTIRYGVDPNTGSVTGQQNQDQFYDAGGNVLRQEPAGAMEYQEFEYDSLGRRVAEIDPLDHSRLLAYDAASNLVWVTDQNEEVWPRGYDPLGRLVRDTNPLGESTTYGYSDAGEQATVSNGLNQTTTTTFDAAGRRVAVSDPLGKITSYTFDANGNETSVTDPNNLTTTSQYDYLGRRVVVTDPLSHSVQYAYNLAGELLVETDAKDQETTHAYDALGRRVSTTDRLNQTTTFAWNALGLQESLTDAENQTTQYVYDEYQRLYQTIWPDHVSPSSPGGPDYGITQTEYDSLNRVLRTTDQLGDTVTHTYDAAGRLLSLVYRTRANSPSGTIADSDSFTYDASSRMLTATSGRYSNTVTLTYDTAGRKASESLTISGRTYTSGTQYDAAGRVSKLIYPDSSEVTRIYTARGQLATLAVGLTTIDTRTYGDSGRLISSSYNNGVGQTRSYNDDGTLATINFSGAPIGDLSYTWDANQNKTSEAIGGVMSGYGFTASYDAEDRLIGWDRSDTNLDQSWDLSPVGDWNSITQNASVQNRTHGPVHEILSASGQAVQHDPKGNMTLIPAVLRPGSDPLKLKWDFDNKVRAADTDNDGVDDVFYRWDALGRRVGRDDGTTSTIYFQDGQQTLADYAAGAAAGSPSYIYVYGSYIDEVVLRSGGSGTRYYHRNQQYSITALTDSGGSIAERYAYTAYGQVTITNASGTVQTASPSNNRFTYTGREWDAGLALYHYRARMYDPVAGRFMSRDPIGFEGSVWHLYQYVSSNPIIGRDPQGLYQLPWWLARIVAQIPIGNIINAVLQELPGTDVSDYSGCEPDWTCDHDPASKEFECRRCIAVAAAANVGESMNAAAIDAGVGAALGLIGGLVFVPFGIMLSLTQWVSDIVTIGRATDEVNLAANSATSTFCTPP